MENVVFYSFGANAYNHSLVHLSLSCLKNPSRPDRETGDLMVPFTVETNSGCFKVINHYIEEEAGESPVDYRIFLTEAVELYGMVEVFATAIDFKMTFEPEVVEDGNLLLKQKSMSLGGLPIPVEYVLKFIKDYYPVPDWVEIDPANRAVHVGLMDMETKSGMKIAAEKFDLRNDEIRFKILFPEKTANEAVFSCKCGARRPENFFGDDGQKHMQDKRLFHNLR